MNAIATSDIQPPLRSLWSETLDRIDTSDPRQSVRPHELRSGSTEDPVRRSSSEGGDGERRAPTSGTYEPGLEDLDQLRSSRDRFLCGTMLGRGGMSVVLQAVQRSLGRNVAVKIARYDLDQRQRERFRAESKLTAWLEHPNITPVYEAGRNYLVMRRISGSDLEHQLSQRRLALPQAVEVLIKVCDAVSFAHHRGIIHRDIKPENILVGDFGEVMLTDWGLALTWSPPSDGVLRAPEIGGGAALCAGTPGYMAPEMALADRKSIGPQTDVFLLGATLYRCLGSDIPFAGADAWQALERSARNEWTPLTATNLPRRLLDLQERAMASDPANRPTVAQFKDGLRSWLMQAQSEVEAQHAVEDARRRYEVAHGNRLRPSLAYPDFAACIAACDRALALSPGLEEAMELRERAMADFALAAVGAGELQLARLIKDSNRLPVIPRSVDPEQQRDASTIRRIGSLMPRAGNQEDAIGLLLKDILARQREADRLASENIALRASYDTIGRERDDLAAHLEREQMQNRRRLRLVVVLGCLAVVLAITVLLVAANA
jgi:predicted Ser/Thr protein kinase